MTIPQSGGNGTARKLEGWLGHESAAQACLVQNERSSSPAAEHKGCANDRNTVEKILTFPHQVAMVAGGLAVCQWSGVGSTGIQEHVQFDGS